MRWMKQIASWFSGATKSLGSLEIGLRAALSGGAPGGWASDHREETAHNTGFNYIAVHAIAAQVAGATVTVFADGEQIALRLARRKFLAASAGSFARWKSTYGADDRETDPLPASHPLVRLLKRPNPYESGANFRYRQAQQIRLTGTCLIWNVPSLSGPPCERYVIPTAMASPVAPTQDLPHGGWRISPVASRYTPVVDDGFVDCPSWYRILGQIIDARQVQVIRLPHAWYLDDGQSPLSAGAKWVDAGEAVDEARFHQLKNGIDPSIVWSLPADVSPDQDEIDRVQAKISAKYGGPENVGRVIVAQNGTSVTPLSATPKDMCFTEGFHDFKAATLALHQTPPVAVGLQEPGAYAAYNASMKAWRHSAVQPLCDMLAESDTEHLAPFFESGLTVEIESDTVDDAELMELQLQNDLAAKVRTKNEWRSVRGLPPLPGPEGDQLVGTDNQQKPAQPTSDPFNFGNVLSGDAPEDDALPPRLTHRRELNTDAFTQKSRISEVVSLPVKSEGSDLPETSSSENLAPTSSDEDLRRRAALIVDILYGIYGDSVEHLLSQPIESMTKAWDPVLHPRDALGRFVSRAEPDVVEVARTVIEQVLRGGHDLNRMNNAVLGSLYILPVKDLESIHRKIGVTPVPRLRSRLEENVLMRLSPVMMPYNNHGDGINLGAPPVSSKVEVYVQNLDRIWEILKRQMSVDDLAQLVGTQPGARVYAFPQERTEMHELGVSIRVVHPHYIAYRSIPAGKKFIDNEIFEVKPGFEGQGIAKRVLHAQAEAAWKLGFRELRIYAKGTGKKLRSLSRASASGNQPPHPAEGYIAWPSLGYDGPIAPLWLERKRFTQPEELQATIRDFKSKFPGVTRISEMMDSGERRKWWNEYGGGLELKLDLNPESAGRRMLDDSVARSAERKNEMNQRKKSMQTPEDPGAPKEPEFVVAHLDENFRVEDLPKARYPELGENPDTMSPDELEHLYRMWDERGIKNGVPERDAKVREQLEKKKKKKKKNEN